MAIGLLGTKIGMTREFVRSGQSIPVTVIKVEKGRVLDVITKDKRGYNAIKLGFFKIKNSKVTKQMKGYFAKKNTEPKKILKEFRVENNDQYKEGNELGLEIVILRLPLVYGYGVKGNIARLTKLVKSGIFLPLGLIQNRRSMIGIDNLVDLLICCADHPEANRKTFLVSDLDIL